MNDKQRVFLRVSVHDVGGRSYQAEAEVRLEREGRSTRFTKAEGAAYAEGHVEPGVYGLVVLAGDLTSPRQQVVVGPEGKTTSAYLGRPDWPFYRLGEHAVPFEPHPDLLAVAFPSGKPDPEEARRQAGEIADRVNLRQVPLPSSTNRSTRVKGPARATPMPAVQLFGCSSSLTRPVRRTGGMRRQPSAKSWATAHGSAYPSTFGPDRPRSSTTGS